MTRWAIAHPVRTLAVWGAIVGILAVFGIGVADRLHRTNLLIPSTDAGKAEELADARFGESSGLLVLLRGPESALDQQGKRLARRLDSRPQVSVTSPWTPGLSKALRPEDRHAMLLIRIQKGFEESSSEIAPSIRQQLDDEVRAPVTANMTGYADISNAIHSHTVEAIDTAQLIAAPLLIIVLLLVFRSPVAAAVPLGLGLAAVGASGGVLDLINRFVVLDTVAFLLAAMMGLALGVDYALLLVSRFREELATGQDVRFATQTAVTTAGHTVRFAGLALIVAMVVALLFSPGSIMLSAVTGVLVAAVLSVITATTALPAILMLLGERINAYQFGRRSGKRPGIAGAALRTLRRPALAAGAVLVLCIALAAPALAMETGPPDPSVLDDDIPQKRDYDAIKAALGEGWGAPYEVVVATDDGAITSGKNLKHIQRFQDSLARSDDVKVVFGPGAIAEQTEGLRDASEQLQKGGERLARGQKALGRLSKGLGKASDGSEQLEAGLQTAAAGAARLADGGDSARAGALQLQAGIATAKQGSALLETGLNRSSPGLARLSRGATKAREGAGRVRTGLRKIRRRAARGLPKVERLRDRLQDAVQGLSDLREPVQIANEELTEAIAALEAMTVGQTDPRYFEVVQSVDRAEAALTGTDTLTGQPVFEGYDGLDAELEAASNRAQDGVDAVTRVRKNTVRLLNGTARLLDGTNELRGGLERLSRGAARLDSGGGRAARGASDLNAGLASLGSGAGELASGVSSLQNGARELSDGLDNGNARTQELVRGVARLEEGITTFEARTARSAEQLGDSERLGKVLGSGYATLAAVETAGSTRRSAASQTVNINNGGTAARILVIQEGNAGRPDNPLRAELENKTEKLAAATGATVLVGGPAPARQDFDTAIAASFPLLIAALCLITFLVLIPLLRSLLLPLIAVLLNVLTVGAALGVLTLLFQGDPLLGGPGFIDDIMRTSIFALVFALSIDYEVFLLARMREGYLQSGDTEKAIEYGLRHTAGVITGAALIMTGVFIAFALAPIVSVRQLGIGLTAAVLLDATVIRLLLLPAVMRLAGDRIWWLPSWIERMLGEERRAPGADEPQLAKVRSLAG